MNQNSSRRYYKVKKPLINFFCALCSQPRSMKLRRTWSLKNLFQMSIMAVLLVLALWPFWGEKSFALFVLPFIFGELIHKFWYRKDLVCPHCGFDAAWYLKDIKMARKKISRFHELKGEQAEKEIKPVTQQDEIESSPPI